MICLNSSKTKVKLICYFFNKMVTNNPKLYLLVTFIFYYSIAFLKDREIKT